MNLTIKIMWPEAGTYIVAVSGGVDSVTLLDLLAQANQKQQWKLVVAHFDHGIREQSLADLKFTHELAANYQLPFEAAQVELGAQASEAAAREARYNFLRQLKKQHKAKAIITAHHLDDKLETALLNIERGTGRQGLTPFRRNSDIIRPLKNVYKQELLAYAKAHFLEWKTDSTNYDLRYRRNYVRHVLVPLLEADQTDFKARLAKQIKQLEFDNYQIDQELKRLKNKITRPASGGQSINRTDLIMMSQLLAQEFLHYLVNELKPAADISSSQIKRLVHFCKTARDGKTLELEGGLRAVAVRGRVTLTLKT